MQTGMHAARLMIPDYYTLLGVSRSATEEEIKSAFRRLARRLHPDVAREPDAEERFKLVAEAYQVLRSPESRLRYELLTMERELEDRRREFEHPRTAPLSAPPAPAVGTADWCDDIAELLDAPVPERSAPLDRPTAPIARTAAPEPGERGEDFVIVADITLEEAVRGGAVVLGFDMPVPGAVNGTRTVARSVEIRLPRNVCSGRRLRVKGAGGPGPNGRKNGDLYVEIAYKPHAFFRVRNQADVWFYLPIAPWEAVLGIEVDVPTLEKPHRVRLPPGVTSGKTLRLPGRGLPKAEGGRGDLLASVRVMTPERPSETERQCYLQLARVSRFNPRRRFST